MKDASAFPINRLIVDPMTGRERFENGLTKRELFAAMAMQGIYSNGEYVEAVGLTEGDPLANYAIMAVNAADALIKELAKPKDQDHE